MVSHSYQNHAQFKRGCSASIHIKECLQCRRPTEHFQKLDHNHEQLNDKIKGVGGAIRLTENDSSLQRGLVADPETARLIDESEYSIGLHQLENDVQEHHDLNEASQV